MYSFFCCNFIFRLSEPRLKGGVVQNKGYNKIDITTYVFFIVLTFILWKST